MVQIISQNQVVLAEFNWFWRALNGNRENRDASQINTKSTSTRQA